MASLVTWFKELRAEFLTASIVPVLLATAVVHRATGEVDPLLFALTMAGAVCLHLGTNTANDYFDHLSGNDALNTQFVRPFTGGSRLIQDGSISPGAVLATAVSFFAAGLAAGVTLALLGRPFALLFGLIGFLSGFFYVAPPLMLANRGLGEPAVGLNFGLLVVMGTYYVQTGSVSAECIVASLPLTLLITSVILINEFQDMNADARVGKRTLVVRSGRRKAVPVFAALSFGAYVPILAGAASRLLPTASLIGAATFPLILKAVWNAKKHYDEPVKLTPSNSLTVLSHMLTGLLMSVGYLLAS